MTDESYCLMCDKHVCNNVMLVWHHITCVTNLYDLHPHFVKLSLGIYRQLAKKTQTDNSCAKK